MSVFRLPDSAFGKKQNIFASSAAKSSAGSSAKLLAGSSDRDGAGLTVDEGLSADRFSERLNQIQNRLDTLENTASFDLDGAIAVAFLREDCKFLIAELQREMQRSPSAPSA
jgi:hypothetical protein